MSQVSIIIGREFNERVRKKSFIITTLLMPLLMIGLMFAPMLIMKYSRGDEKQIAVIDDSGLIAPQLQSGEELVFQTTDLSTEAARKELTDKFGVLYIGSDILTNPNNVKLYVNSSSSLTVESNITGQLEEIIEAEKLKSYNIENLSQILQEVKTTVGMQTFRNDESQEEESQAKSSVIATGVGFVLGMILYMFLLIYGSMVMQSVIEEKNSRVLEVMVSSVRPFDLMLGKILGVASVAVVQVLIWGVLCAVGAAVAVHMMPADVLAGVQAMQHGVPDAAASIRHESGDAAGDGRRDRFRLYPPYLRLPAAVRLRRIPLLLGDVRRRGFGRGQHSGRPAAADADHHSDHPRPAGDDNRHQRPQFTDGLLVLDDPFHLARGDDGAYSVRHSPLGGDPFAGDPLRLVYRDGVAGGQDLPRGNLHVRQKADVQGALQVDSVQVLVRTAIAENTGPYDVVRPGLFSGRDGFAIRERKRFRIRGFFVSLSGRVRRSGSVQT